eukprot:CAMPEP_0184692568 /NCGR_PEP_ID=MMETSP0313-20130426/997_1 /TAXON_ID=2792 /ORGANISM="Porphyridium aerugineum, Strain SAG 1380-2" /LENGTH=123 /DNA_ID=CAMNT_0027150407 /DNA_START=174 /DNA_END=544 /DNA_ORIENTATION=+
MAEEEKKTQEPSLTIKACDMNETMQHDAIEVAKRAIANSKVEKEMAEHIKKEFDKLYGAKLALCRGQVVRVVLYPRKWQFYLFLFAEPGRALVQIGMISVVPVGSCICPGQMVAEYIGVGMDD